MKKRGIRIAIALAFALAFVGAFSVSAYADSYKAPAAKTGLVYKDADQVLITAGTGYNFKYAFGDPTNKEIPQKGWTNSIDDMAKKDAGDYRVWYFYNNGEEQYEYVDVTIEKKKIGVISEEGFGKVYDGGTDLSKSVKQDAYLNSNDIQGDDELVIDELSGHFSDKIVRADGYTINTNSNDSTGLGSDGVLYLSVKLAGLGVENYDPEPLYTKAYITQRPVNVYGIHAKDKEYDGTTEVQWDYTDVHIDGNIMNDDVSVEVKKGSFSDKNVGEKKTVHIKNTELTGEDANNYSINKEEFQDRTYASITPRIVSVWGITAREKVYNGRTNVRFNSDGIVYVKDGEEDAVAASDGLLVRVEGEFVDPNAGKNKLVDITGITLSKRNNPDNLNNYELDLDHSQSWTWAKIAQRPVTVSGGITALDKDYDGTTGATLTSNGIVFGQLAPGKGLVPSDEGLLGIDLNAPGSDGVVGEFVASDGFTPSKDVEYKDGKVTDKTVKITYAGNPLTGEAKDNYRFVENDETQLTCSAVLSPLPANLVWDYTEEKYATYTGKEIENTATVTNPIGNEAVKVSEYGSESKGTAAGSYTATAEALDNPNYTLENVASSQQAWKIVIPPTPGPEPIDDPVADLVKMIQDLPSPDAVTVDDAAAINAAMAAYNALTDEQKKDSRLTPALKNKLFDCEAALQQAEQDQKAADEALILINALPNDPAEADETAARAALNVYNALTEKQKALLGPEANMKMSSYQFYFECKDAEATKAKLKSVKAKKNKKATAKWAAVSTADGYQLYYKAKGAKAKKVNINNASTVKKTVKKLKAGKVYTFKVRTVNEIYNPSTGLTEKHYGKWSNKKKIKAKK